MKSLLEEIFVASEMPTTTGVNTCNCSRCRAERQRLFATKTQPCSQCGHADIGSRNGFSESAFEFEDAPSIVQTEWNNSAIIRAKYSIGDYTELSAKVKSWVGTGAVSYIETAIQEWDAASSSVKSHFRDDDTKKLNFDGLGLDDRRSYINLKRLYMKEGISNPLNYIRDNIVSVTFLGGKASAHKGFQVKLDDAARLMSSRGYSFSYPFGGFVPRTLNKNIDKLSNHALGKAIDFDWHNNPHIMNKNVRIVISNVCKDILMKGFTRATKSNILLDAVKDPTVLREASDYFKANYDENKHTTAAISSSERGDLRKYQKTGFLNLDPAFIKIMQEVCFGWGGAWTSQKDFMHFELTGGSTATAASPPSTTGTSALSGGESARVLQNRSNAQTLGWGAYYDQINDLILPYSGQ